MKSNAEMRKESYAVVRSRWFWIIFGVTLLLQGICQGAGWLLGSLHGSMGIVSPADFFSKKLSMLRQGLDYTLPTAEAYRQMAYAGTLEMLVGYVLGAVALFGITAVLLKAVADDRKDVLGAAFGGFGRPLGVTWLLMVMNFFVGLWMLLLIVPGIVAIYRYRAEYNEWPGGYKDSWGKKHVFAGDDNKEVFSMLRADSDDNPDHIRFIDETAYFTTTSGGKEAQKLSETDASTKRPLVFLSRSGHVVDEDGRYFYYRATINYEDETVVVDSPGFDAEDEED